MSNKINTEQEELINTIRLIRTQNIGDITFAKIIERYKNATNAVEQLPELLKLGSKEVKLYPKNKALEELELATKNNATIISYTSPNYPPLLKHIADRPPILFAKGNLNLLKKACFGIVGSRNASIHAKRKAFEYATNLNLNGFAVVSGLALGVDTASHEGSINKGTIAVLGTGLDVYYPKENTDLQNRIAEVGCIITEIPFGVKPLVSNFPKRNRIISGISRGVLIIEASEKSGSLITARTALDQNREVFALPGDSDDARNLGSNRLIKEHKAHLVQNIADILEHIKKVENFEVKETPDLFNQNLNTQFTSKELKEAREKIINSLNFNPLPVEILLNELNLSYNVLSMVLLELEISGVIERFANNSIALAKKVK
jgi:DNA processing protein